MDWTWVIGVLVTGGLLGLVGGFLVSAAYIYVYWWLETPRSFRYSDYMTTGMGDLASFWRGLCYGVPTGVLLSLFVLPYRPPTPGAEAVLFTLLGFAFAIPAVVGCIANVVPEPAGGTGSRLQRLLADPLFWLGTLAIVLAACGLLRSGAGSLLWPLGLAPLQAENAHHFVAPRVNHPHLGTAPGTGPHALKGLPNPAQGTAPGINAPTGGPFPNRWACCNQLCMSTARRGGCRRRRSGPVGRPCDP